MLRTVRDACQIHPMALDYTMGEQIENLSDVIDRTSEDAREFFEKNFVTKGMSLLLSQGLKRLAGKSDQAVFELKQAMGGGKTHSMIALGLLARDAELRGAIVPDIAKDAPFENATIVALNGRLKFDQRFIWGEIARQLDKESEFAKFWKDGADAPDEKDWINLIGDEPTLILLDELPPYFDYAVTRVVGGGNLAQVTTYALSNLLSASLKLKRCCIVISNLSGSYEGASKELQKAIRNFAQEANRQARSVTPVDLATQEIYDILRKRLFKSLPDEAAIGAVASAYAASLAEAAKSKSIAKSAEQIADEIHASYPFHPSVKHVIALFKENESYRQTRGLMQFVSKMIKSVWEQPYNDVHLIGCQHLDLNINDVREEVNKISNLQGAIAHDISAGGSAVAELVDANLGNDAASQLASLLLTASLSESIDAVKGFTKVQLLEYLIAPNRTVIEFQDAFEAFRSDAWYLHRKENDAWYFSNIENLRKRIDNRAANAPQPKIDAEMKRRLEDIFKPVTRIAYQEVEALPKIDEIKLNGPRVCLVLSPDSKVPPEEAQRFWESVTEKNNFCVVTGDGSDLASLEEKTRRIWAIARVLEETGGDRSSHKAELDEEGEQAEYEFNSTVVSLFNRVYYPTKGKLTFAKLSMTFGSNAFKGEEQVEKALAEVGSSKLYRSVEENADMLLTRAEDMLWPGGGERRIPWRDVVSRTVTNERWLWLPAKGIETLRSIAAGQGRWRYTEDGYIEKGPFPPPRTGVSVSERDYDDQTGEATLAILARDAGKSGRVHYAASSAVGASSPTVPDTIWKTDATALWFVAIDPDGQHDTGDPVKWTNKLTLTHQPRSGGGKRIVELTVKPRGQIRWNTTGANPREGAVYNGPIELDSTEAVTIYAYAEDEGVCVNRNFTIPAIDQKGPAIDKTKPARLNKRVDFRGNAEAFKAINHAKALNVKLFGGVLLTVGNDTLSVTTRFGSDAVIKADDIEAFINAARLALGNETADVVLRIDDLEFGSGHDLETFLQRLCIEPMPGEVEQ
jgi:hypothetical protein